MDGMNVNVPLLRKVVEWVEEQEGLQGTEREWYQATWISRYNWCGTQMCVAGKIAILEGWTPVFTDSEHMATATVEKDGIEENVETVALEALGVSREIYWDKFYLFDGDLTAAQVRKQAEGLAGGPL